MFKELTNECIVFLNTVIESTKKESENLLQIYDQSIFFEEEQLIKKSLLKIEKYSEPLFEENNTLLLGLSIEAMKKLLESDLLCVNEVDVFKKVIKWNEKNNEKDLFCEFKSLIRFPLMSNAELLSTVFCSKKLSEEELLNLLRFKEFGSEVEIPFNKNSRKVNLNTRGIFKNKLVLSDLIKRGWKIIYQKDYNYKTTKDELMKIKSSYGKNRLLCVCGKEKNKDIIELAAIDTIENVLKETNDRNVASKGGVEGLYWYLVGGKSFGFSNESNIDLKDSDMTTGELKLSWRLNTLGGGRRVGDKDLSEAVDWEKIILIF